MLRGHRDLKVFQLSYKLAMEIFHLSKAFPREDLYSLTDQIRRSAYCLLSCRVHHKLGKLARTINDLGLYLHHMVRIARNIKTENVQQLHHISKSPLGCSLFIKRPADSQEMARMTPGRLRAYPRTLIHTRMDEAFSRD